MNLSCVTIQAGLQRPVRLLHLSDTHLCFADDRDCQRKRDLAASRIRYFSGSNETLESYLDEAVAFARQHDCLIVHTGDLIDFVSHLNLEKLHERFALADTFFAVGNHEYSLFVGEAKEDNAYKMQSFHHVQDAAPNPIECASRQVGGLNLVAFDNGYYRFSTAHLDFLKAELQRGLPTILLMHAPIHTENLARHMRDVRKEPCAYLCGSPSHWLDTYSEQRREQQTPDQPTLDFIDFATHQPLVRAVLAGHLHFQFADLITPTLPQFVAGAGFHNQATLVNVI